MKRNRPFLVVLSVMMLLLTFSNVSSKNYYLSNEGSDGANGNSPGTAWETISKLNSMTLSPGDSVFFEANGIWRETLVPRYSGTSGNYIVYTRYGEGKNPAILGSIKPDSWTSSGTNIWKASGSYDNLATEYYPGAVFFIDDDSVTWGNYQNYNASFSNLTQEFDYTFSGSTLYVYSEKNPGDYQSVEVTQSDRCVAVIDNEPVSYIEFDGIDLHFARLAGFDAGYPAVRGATDLIFRDCNIAYIGERASGYAYGVAAWHSNFLVERCNFSDCGRRAISINLYLDMEYPENRVIDNIIVRKSVFKRGFHTTGLDLSSQQTSNDTITNVFFYNNYLDDSEHSLTPSNWISNQVFTQEGDSYINNVYIYNNIFIHATGRAILIEDGDSIYIWNNTICGHNPNIDFHPYANVSLNYPNEVDYRNNILYDDLPDNNIQNHGVLMYYVPSKFIAKDYNLYYSLHPKTDRNFAAHRPDNNLAGDVWYYTTNDWNEYLTDNPNFEQHSPAPQDPLFEDYFSDLRLKDGSPAIGAGVKIDMVNTDFFGNPVNDPPDLGAIKYGAEPYKVSVPVDKDYRLLKIYPNPARDFISILLPQELGNGNCSVRFFDIQGKLAIEKSGLNGNVISLDLSANLESGLYFVQISDGIRTFSGKLLLE